MSKVDDITALRRLQRVELALKPARQKKADRPCLKCRKPFTSEWCGNRLCVECRKVTAGVTVQFAA